MERARTRRPLSLRPLLAAAAAAAVIVAAVATPPAGATVVRRETIVSGDTILADVLIPGEIDEYVFEAPRGAKAQISFGKVPPGNWKTSLGLFDQNYQALSLSGTSPTAASTPVPFPVSGIARLLFSTSGRSVGGYRFKFGLSQQRSFAASGKGDAAAAPLWVGAVAGAELTVTIRWRGAAPVTLTSVTGPDGALTSAEAPVVQGATSVQAGFVTPVFGDYSVALDVPAGTKSWNVKVAVKPPHPVPGTVRDLREDDPDGRPPLDLRNTADTPVIVVTAERGGPNDMIMLPGGALPGVRLLDPRSLGCGGAALEAGETPTAYRFSCANGWRAEIRDATRAGGRITGFTAAEIVSPNGSGSSVLSDAVYNAGGQPVAWTEVRTFDASGAVHRIEVFDILRNNGGTILSYSVLHTPPGGTPRRYDYAPVRGY